MDNLYFLSKIDPTIIYIIREILIPAILPCLVVLLIYFLSDRINNRIGFFRTTDYIGMSTEIIDIKNEKQKEELKNRKIDATTFVFEPKVYNKSYFVKLTRHTADEYNHIANKGLKIRDFKMIIILISIISILSYLMILLKP